MRLKSIEFSQLEGTPQEWRLKGLTLEDVNLLVGKNACGKSMSLRAIYLLANLLSKDRMVNLGPGSGYFNVNFDDDLGTCHYSLRFEDFKVTAEKYMRNGSLLLGRGKDGIGKILYEKLDGMMDFQTPVEDLAVTARQDSIQHSYLSPLVEWAKSLYYYPFNTLLGKERYHIISKEDISNFDPKDPESAIPIFIKGLADFNGEYRDSILMDMEILGYPLDTVGITPIPGPATTNGPPAVLYVKEKALNGITDQFGMSTGMFRALSVLIQITYAQMSNTAGTILIDDIGEGLDFERSYKLIHLLVDKAKQSKVQLIMATNDRFVMNAVPLECWSVLNRTDSGVEVLNYANSKAKFDDFKFTGMNNFDFFATDFLHGEEGSEA